MLLQSGNINAILLGCGQKDGALALVLGPVDLLFRSPLHIGHVGNGQQGAARGTQWQSPDRFKITKCAACLDIQASIAALNSPSGQLDTTPLQRVGNQRRRNAEFRQAIGLDIDLSEVGMGIRCQRFSMIVEDGVVTALNTGDVPGQASISGAENILAQL